MKKAERSGNEYCSDLLSNASGNAILEAFTQIKTRSPSEIAVVADSLLERGNSYGRFLSRLAHHWPYRNRNSKKTLWGRLPRDLSRFLQRDLHLWFPNQILATEAYPLGVMVDAEGIQGFDMSFGQWDTFVERGGIHTFEQWMMTDLAIEENWSRYNLLVTHFFAPDLDRAVLTDEGRSAFAARLESFRRIARLKTLKSLRLSEVLTDEEAQAIASSSSIERLSIKLHYTDSLADRQFPLSHLAQSKALRELTVESIPRLGDPDFLPLLEDLDQIPLSSRSSLTLQLGLGFSPIHDDPRPDILTHATAGFKSVRFTQ